MGAPSKDVYIAVMGLTGAGKSRFISRVTGRKDVRVGHTLESATEEVTPYTFRYGGYNFTLIDTPGFDDSRMSDDVIVDRILNWLKTYAEQGKQLNGIIYLHRILDPRIQGSGLWSMRMFRKLCGANYFSNVILGTTFWDSITPSEGTRRERELLSNDNFWGQLAKKGSQIRRIGASSVEDDRKILLDIARNHQSSLLSAQKEMQSGATPAETTAAREVNTNIAAMAEIYNQQFELEKQKLLQAIENLSLQRKQEFDAERERYEEKLRVKEAEARRHEQQRKEWEERQRVREVERTREVKRLAREVEETQQRLRQAQRQREKKSSVGVEPQPPLSKCVRRHKPSVAEVTCDRCKRRFKPKYEQFYHCCLCRSGGKRDNYDQCTRCGPRCREARHGVMRLCNG